MVLNSTGNILFIEWKSEIEGEGENMTLETGARVVIDYIFID